jgi:hypothetical protein
MKTKPQQFKKEKNKTVSINEAWELINPHAAGIDIGSKARGLCA